MVLVWCFGAGTGGQLGNGALVDALLPVRAYLPLLTCCPSASPTPSLQCQWLPDVHVDETALKGLGEGRGSEGDGACDPVPSEPLGAMQQQQRQQQRRRPPRQDLAQSVVQHEDLLESHQHACAEGVQLPGCLHVACGGNHAVAWWADHRGHPDTPSQAELRDEGPPPFPGCLHARIQLQRQQQQQALVAVTWGHAVAGASARVDKPSSAAERHRDFAAAAAAAAPPAALSTREGSSGCGAEKAGCAVVDPATGTLVLRRPWPVQLGSPYGWSRAGIGAPDSQQLMGSEQRQKQQMTTAQRQVRVDGQATPSCAAAVQEGLLSGGGSPDAAGFMYSRGTPTAHVCIRQVACGWEHTIYLSAGGQVLVAGRGSRGQLGLGPHVVEAHQPMPLHLPLPVPAASVSSVAVPSMTPQGATTLEATPVAAGHAWHVTSVAAGTWHTLVAVAVAGGGSGGSSSTCNVGLEGSCAMASRQETKCSGGAAAAAAAAAEAHPADGPLSPVAGCAPQADGDLHAPAGPSQANRSSQLRVLVLGCGSNRWQQLGHAREREGQPDARSDAPASSVGAGEGAGPRPVRWRGAGHGGRSCWSWAEVALQGRETEAAAPATVVAGGEHSALLDAGGRLWLWGRGLGGEAAAAAAAASGVSGSAALRTADIAAAGLATCADATDKAALACAGRGPERAPGVGPKRDSRQVGGRGSGTPVQVHVPLPTRAAPTAMSATEAAQALASVREDGVGCPEPEGTEAAAAAAAVGGECHWRQVALGWHHALALDSAGRVWAWGDNRHGQLARPPPPPPPPLLQLPPPQQVQLQPPAHSPQDGARPSPRPVDSDVVCRQDTVEQATVPLGERGLAAKPNGTTHEQQTQELVQEQQRQQDAWEQGDQWVARSCLPLLVHLPGRATCVSAGSEHSAVAVEPCATRPRGSVWTWGWGEHGQLGLGDTRDRWRPEEVRLPGCTGISNAGQAGTAEGEGAWGEVSGGVYGGAGGDGSAGAASKRGDIVAWGIACGAGFTVCYPGRNGG